ncbi:MAG: nucleotidyltransferase domain-containing protein [Chloroflexi bacterium]|nr:nucleotidyltransferase domain-containing protein [Chloroflexota bacterium]
MLTKIELIKKNILDALGEEGIEADRIILFGSRARGDFDKFSDYDLLVVVRPQVSVPAKIDLSTRIQRKLAQFLIDVDVMIKSIDEVDRRSNEIGTVTREAMREGVVI